MKSKRILSAVLTLVLMLSTIFSTNVLAKTNLPTISKSKPLTTYTYNSSGKVYAYTASNLKTKTGGYIACSTDECKIIEISGKAVKVTYPVSNGTKTAWFSRDAFTKRNLASDAADSSFVAKTTATTYKWKGKSSTFGSVAKGDKCYLLIGNEKSDWVQIIYPVSKGYKMGWVKGSDYAKMTKKTPTPTPKPEQEITTSEWEYPMKDAYVCGNDWREYYSKRPSRPYHVGIDIASKTGDKNVYAAADGTVVKTGFNSANGNYVIIKHKLSGTTVYSFYAHLKSISASSGKNISKGTKIGVFGNTGSGSAGTHLHFAITDKLSNNGGYYGYVGSFSGNKTTYPEKTGTTFYNPHYVIKYNKLP